MERFSSENSELIFQLSRRDLWEEKYGKLENLDQLISDKMNKFKIKVGQAYNFYEIIGTEDKNSIVIDKENEKEKIMAQQVQNPKILNQVKKNDNNNIHQKPDLFDPDNNNDNGDNGGDEEEESEENYGLLD